MREIGDGVGVGFRYYVNTSVVYVVITTKTNIGVKFILVLGSIFFRHSVVGGVLQKSIVIYGGADVIALTRAF